jgi:exodeoxyribonuclease V alpha subunit
MDNAMAAPPVLEQFNRAGVLNLADVHVAKTLARVCGVEDESVLLAAALAVRAPRLGHVCLDLASVESTVAPEEDAEVAAESLEWPAATDWLASLESSSLVGEDAPLHLEQGRLYLNRSWRSEQLVIRSLLERVSAEAPAVAEKALAEGLAAVANEQQRAAVENAVRRRLSVIAGGPGTGKTTTIKTILGVLRDQAAAAGMEPPQVALVAPTGKAAQRVTESIADDDYTATTIHKLLRREPGNATRFRHNARNPLTHDVVIVDETSMVSLDLMAKLLDAVRPDARLIFVGDPDQLVSVESGAVLGDVVGPVRSGTATGPMAEAIVVLQHVYRHGGGIAELARAIQSGSPAEVLAVLESGRDDVTWLPIDIGAADGLQAALAGVREAVVGSGRRLIDAARHGDAEAALACLDEVRLLCAHRRGPYGVEQWVAEAEKWLATDVEDFDPSQAWYVGRPVLVTSNDYQLGVLNGDTGVTIAEEDGGLQVAFRLADGIRLIRPQRLENVQTVHAMTIHKSQGSQFDTVVALLPDPTSKILTRELLYTAVTRAKSRLIVAATPAAITAAVERQVVRSSGLRDALWA